MTDDEAGRDRRVAADYTIPWCKRRCLTPPWRIQPWFDCRVCARRPYRRKCEQRRIIQFNFVTTAKHGSGKIALINVVATPNSPTCRRRPTLGALSFTLSENLRVLDRRSTFEIEIPDGWPEPFEPIAGDSMVDGALTGVTVDGRKVSGSLSRFPVAYKVLRE